MAISTVEILPDENFVVLGTENTSDTIAGVFSENAGTVSNQRSLLTVLGTQGEKENGYMTVSSLRDWIDRYVDAFTGLTYSGGATLIDNINSPNPTSTLPACTSVTFGVECFNGLTGNLAADFWSVHNYLQYGGSCIVSGAYAASGITWSPTGSNPLIDKTKIPNMDVVFSLRNTRNQAEIAHFVVAGRNKDCMGIIGVSGSLSGFGEPVNGVGGQTTNAVPIYSFGTTYAQYGICVIGNKEHFGLENSSLDIITTPLMADVAGCIARTDREFYPWYSPAGVNRGGILNVLRVPDQPSEAMQTVLQDKAINFVLTLNGQGTFLFYDKTLKNTAGDPLSKINVARLYIYVAKTLGPLANQYLFEFNNAGTRTTFVSAASAILDQIKASNGILDYTIVCDETNNTQEVIDDGKFIVDLTLTPTRAIDKIVIRITNSSGS